MLHFLCRPWRRNLFIFSVVSAQQNNSRWPLSLLVVLFRTLFTQLKFCVLTTKTTENENSRFRYFFSFPLLLKLHASIDIWTFKRVGEKEATGGRREKRSKSEENFFINRRFLFSFRSDLCTTIINKSFGFFCNEKITLTFSAEIWLGSRRR